MFKLDSVDAKIVEGLQADPDTTHSKIAHIVKMSQPAIGIRVEKLKKTGMLKKIYGVNLSAVDILLAEIRIRTRDARKLAVEAMEKNSVLNAYIISGECNLIVLIAGATESALDSISNDFRSDPRVEYAMMNVIIHFERDLVLPVHISNGKLLGD